MCRPTSAKRRLSSPSGLSRVHKCDRRQTDLATEKCVAKGVIACAARSDSAKEIEMFELSSK